MSMSELLILLETLSPEELREAKITITEAIRRIESVKDSESAMDDMVRERSEDVGRKMGDLWESPVSAIDSYPTGAVVYHKDKLWRNLTPANVWEPGESGWREISADEAYPPEFVPPSGAHDVYSEGDRVTYKGSVWRSLIDGNVWSPDELMHSWFREGVSGEQSNTSPEEEPSGTPWEPGKALSVGDVVTYNGSNYTVVQGHTTQIGWEPPILPSLFSPTNS